MEFLMLERIKKITRKRSFHLLLIILVLFWLISLTTQYKSIVETLSAPELPELQVKNNQGKWLTQQWLEQNWGNKTDDPSQATKKYHHLSQGTRTLPLPYNWIISLEQPSQSPFTMLFSKQDKFVDEDYILRFGFIRSKSDPDNNPDGLPIGFAKTFSQNIKGISRETETIGLTCAACHTSHFIHGDGLNEPVEYIVEGGPATTDLGLLQKALTAAIGQTVLSSKIPVFDGRFDRFARNVLGTQYGPTTKLALSKEFLSVVEAQLQGGDVIEVTEGFSRLDALNRIGNEVFSDNIDRPENYAPIDAPVNYPHIWTAPWFDWVQYDASVMGPLIRNVGEAMGVKAYLDVKSPAKDNRFSSSIPVENLVWMEEFLAGEQPNKDRGFSGLKEPKWLLSKIDHTKADQGKAVYQKHCQGCHLPTLTSAEIWDEKYFDNIAWKTGGLANKTKEKVLQLNVIPLKQIGTDNKQAGVMINRTVDTSGAEVGAVDERTYGLQMASNICVRDPNEVAKHKNVEALYPFDANYYQKKPLEHNDYSLVDQWISDGANVPFGYALASTVDKAIDAWFIRSGVNDASLQEKIKGGRPNCIQAGWGYKARPLNGVWATAPFLHNGSVATIRDLICPSNDQRPRFIQLGSLNFDAENIGIKQPDNYQELALEYFEKGLQYDDKGYFILDSNIVGNLNSGHHFSEKYDTNQPYWQQESGVIGPKIEPQQCDALLEYLKTI